MPGYVDGFLLVIKKKDIPAYRKMAAGGEKIWRKHGALDYRECIGDDLKPKSPGMKLLQFPNIIKTKPGETVVFSYIRYKSRKHRDQVNAKVMKDPAMNDPDWQNKPMPFNPKRMAYGGFRILVG